MKYDVPAIRKAIQEAKMDAEEVKVLDSSDYGSCNMDFVYLSAPKMSERTGMEISGRVPYRAGWHGRILKVYDGDGAASLNTRMCKAFLNSFRAAGFDAAIYYQLD